MIEPTSGNMVPPGAMPDEVKDDQPIMASKVCSRCKVEKSVNGFSPNKNRPLGVASHCKSCTASKAREKRSLVEYSEDYKEKARIRASKWRDANIQRNIEMKKSWRLKNLSTKNAANARRRASKVGATPNWLTEAQKEEIKNFYWLAQDLKRVTGEVYHVDHIIPLKGENVCGLHVPWNLQVLPASENRKKSNKVIL